jgi:hypothetical protein
MAVVKTCKHCGNTSDKAPWKVNNGVAVGLVCRRCASDQGAVYAAKMRATPEGKAASDAASNKYYASAKGAENYARKKAAPDAKERFTKYSLDWAKRHPGKALAKVRKRDLAKLQRVPLWANDAAIKEIYVDCPPGMQVDHIIPLQGELVSGLHCEANLQYLTAAENASKGNSFNPETFVGP